MVENQTRRISILALGFSLGSFFVTLYALCILFYFIAPNVASGHRFLEQVLPYFTLLTWPSFFLGLVESFVWGWYVAVVFAPLYNYFAAKFP